MRYALALTPSFRYKRGLIRISPAPKAPGRPHRTTTRQPCKDLRYGRSEKKNIAVAAWHAPFRRRAQEADLCRRQGFRRIAPSASSRPEDRHVQRPPGSEGQERILTRTEVAPPIAAPLSSMQQGATLPAGGGSCRVNPARYISA